MVNQFYDAEITKEYVMRGNSAIIKCLIPSFVADFVQVVAWINEEKEEIVPSKDFSAGKHKQLSLILHQPPLFSFVLWVFLNNFVFTIYNFIPLVVNQFYDAEIIKEYVMRGNSAIVKCSIPSFVADFVQVVSWADEEGVEYTRNDDYSLGIWKTKLKLPSQSFFTHISIKFNFMLRFTFSLFDCQSLIRCMQLN